MSELKTSKRPVVWLVAANFGASSEVWMHRQASGMSRIDLRVVTCNYRDPESYPPKGFEVVTLDGLPKQSSNRLIAQMQFVLDRIRPGSARCHCGCRNRDSCSEEKSTNLNH